MPRGFSGLISIALVLMFISVFLAAPAFSSSPALPQSGAVQAGSIAEIKTALEVLTREVAAASGTQRFTVPFQEEVLKKSESFIGSIEELLDSSTPDASLRLAAKDSFLMNREILKKIRTINKEIIGDIQENKLDQVADPLAFFKSPAWREPQRLIAMSSYWLGWNGYYGSLVCDEKDTTRNTLLEEAVEAFSRSFLDSGEDGIIINSLFGRGLCYRQMKAYASALQDFHAAKETLKKEDPLYWKCGYEEASVSYEMGNVAEALKKLDEMEKLGAAAKLSPQQQSELKTLRATILVARLNKQEARGDTGAGSGEELQRKVSELKELSKGDPGVDAVYYGYVQEHGAVLENLTYAELGPVGALAMGDRFFERSSYDKALSFYLPLYKEAPSILQERRDVLCFRIAYGYCKKEAWKEAIPYLESFGDRFPTSPLLNQALSLYYLAASNQYREHATQEDYQAFINALKRYLATCTACPERSEAHVQLAKYYQEQGKMEQALGEYSQVAKDSPYYPQAAYHVLKSQTDQLESFRKKGQLRSKKAMEIYRNGVRLIGELEAAERGTGETLQPAMMILQARFFLFGPDGDCRKSIKKLENFESSSRGEKALLLEAVRLRIDAWLRLQMAGKAEAEVERFLGAGKNNPDPWTGLLNLASQYEEEAKVSPKREGARAGDLNAAAALMIYRKLSTLPAKDASHQQVHRAMRLRMAKIYLTQNKLSEAAELYQSILAGNSLPLDAMHDLGLLYEKTGKWQDALHVWSKLSKELATGSKDWLEARYKTASALNMIGARDKSCALITMTMTLHPDMGSDILAKQYNGLRSEVCNEGR